MDEQGTRRMGESERGLVGGMALILVAGFLLGVTYNWFGLRAAHPWGLPWVGQDLLSELAATPAVTVADDSAAAGQLPDIPDIGRPVPIELPAFRRYVEAHAALILDARDPEEYREGHVPGAVNLPYDRAATDPESMEHLDVAGRPIITYCGGGECEVSISLAHELIGAGYTHIAVYLGGFPEWRDAELPVRTGESPE